MAKTEGELKKQAEKALAKFAIFETNLLNNELEGLSDEEQAIFMMHFLAGLGEFMKPASEDEAQIDPHQMIDLVQEFNEEVYGET